jgi:hypothetical protein
MESGDHSFSKCSYARERSTAEATLTLHGLSKLHNINQQCRSQFSLTGAYPEFSQA